LLGQEPARALPRQAPLSPVTGRRRTRVLLLVFVLAAGCESAAEVTGVATQQDLLQLRTDLSQTQQTAQRAKADVDNLATQLGRGGLATLELGKRDAEGNWPMVLHVRGLPRLSAGGYYDLYLTRKGKPLVSCGTFNVSGRTDVRLSAAYNLEAFDKNGWVIVRKTPDNHFQPNQVVLAAS